MAGSGRTRQGLTLVADELRHQHSSALEWIIILLIAFEILVFIFHDWLG